MVISRIKWKIIYVGHYAKWLSLLSWIVAKFRLETPSSSPFPPPTPCQFTPHPRLILSCCYPNGLQANSCPRRLQSSAQKGDFFSLLSAVVLEWTNWATDWRGAATMLFTAHCLRFVETWSVLHVDFGAKESSLTFNNRKKNTKATQNYHNKR